MAVLCVKAGYQGLVLKIQQEKLHVLQLSHIGEDILKIGAADIDHDHIVFVKALVNRYHIIGEEGGFPDGPALDQYIFIFRHIEERLVPLRVPGCLKVLPAVIGRKEIVKPVGHVNIQGVINIVVSQSAVKDRSDGAQGLYLFVGQRFIVEKLQDGEIQNGIALKQRFLLVDFTENIGQGLLHQMAGGINTVLSLLYKGGE